eukprot:TRINITY_DN3318_c0_g1_i2.p1 TRINITY_DN3318_c0_g1~~TRINITY_DN3318_c0_g1_i2.p1  ORF type:complete len:1052 (+),score=404.56 TRINITY_DN3318_c0_g1_i2:1533-4688(+)
MPTPPRPSERNTAEIKTPIKSKRTGLMVKKKTSPGSNSKKSGIKSTLSSPMKFAQKARQLFEGKENVSANLKTASPSSPDIARKILVKSTSPKATCSSASEKHENVRDKASVGSVSPKNGTLRPRKPAMTPERAQTIVRRVIRSYVLRKKWSKLIQLYRESSHSRTQRYRFKVLSEIYESEKTYMTKLKFLTENYLRPLREALTSGKPILPQEYITEVFSNIEIIFTVNKEFLTDLERRHSEFPQNQLIGDIFIRFVDFLKVYTIYVNNYDKAVVAINKLKKSTPFGAFLEKTKQIDPEHREVFDYLILAVQRIPRYKLLLEDLVKHTPPEHIDFNNLVNAFEKMKTIAESINEKKREAESVARVVEVQNMMIGAPAEGLVLPHRRFVRDGNLADKESKSQGDCWFFLFNDALLYCKRHHVESFKFKWMHHISDISISNYQPPATASLMGAKVEEDVHASSFVIKAPGDIEMVVFARTLEEKKAWKKDIRKLQKQIAKKRYSFLVGCKPARPPPSPSVLEDVADDSQCESMDEEQPRPKKRKSNVISFASDETCQAPDVSEEIPDVSEALQVSRPLSLSSSQPDESACDWIKLNSAAQRLLNRTYIVNSKKVELSAAQETLERAIATSRAHIATNGAATSHTMSHELTQEIDHIRTSVIVEESAISHMESINRRLEKELAIYTKKSEHEDHALADMRSRCAALSEEKYRNQVHFDGISVRKAELQADHDALLKNLNDVKCRFRNVSAARSEQLHHNTRLEEEVRQLGFRIQMEESDLKMLQEHVLSMSKELEETKASLKQAEESKGRLEKEAEAISLTLDKFTQNKNHLEGTREKQRIEVLKVKEQIASASEKKTRYERRIRDLQSSADLEIKKNAVILTDNNKLEAELHSLKAALDVLTQEKHSVREVKESLSSELEKSTAEYQDQLQNAMCLRKRRAELESDVNDSKEKLEREIEELKEMEEWKEKIELDLSSIRDAFAEEKKAREQLENLQEQMRFVATQVKIEAEEKSKSKREMEELNTRLQLQTDRLIQRLLFYCKEKIAKQAPIS